MRLTRETKGTAAGASKTGVGAVVASVLVDQGLLPPNPDVIIAATWAISQAAHTLASGRFWRRAWRTIRRK